MKRIRKTFNTRSGSKVTWEVAFGIPPQMKPKVRRALKEFMSGYYDNMKGLVDERNEKVAAAYARVGFPRGPTLNETVSISGENYKAFLAKEEKAVCFFNVLAISFSNGLATGEAMPLAVLAERLVPQGDFSPDLKELIGQTGLQTALDLIDVRKGKPSAGPAPRM